MATEVRQRVMSGMRPTGALHLGHYHGVLKNWLRLQDQYECFFSVVDWHALTTEYETPAGIQDSAWEMVVDWLAVGIDPNAAQLYLQSRVPEHAELHLLLSMVTPQSWLERVPSYKDQQERLGDKDLSTYGFLGYPLLQTADIIIVKADCVPVGEDQVAHVELAREVVRRFNYLYGREPGFEEKAAAAAAQMGRKNHRNYLDLLKKYQEKGDAQALEQARSLVESQPNLSGDDRALLAGFLEGGGRMIFPEPAALLTEAPKMPGTDGQKMSKSYNNTIALREDAAAVERKVKTMPTDPARVRRTDPGEPEKCPVWELHKVYSDQALRDWVEQGCRNAGIGCLDCKKPLIESIIAEQAPFRERAAEYLGDPGRVREIINEGSAAARRTAQETLAEVRTVMGLHYD